MAVIFLFTDIEGSTRLWDEHPLAMSQALLQHDHLLRSFIENHDGRVFKTVGDAFCAVFSDAAPALETALAAQRWLRPLQVETGAAPLPLRVRMALHSGVFEERDADYFGPVLNRTARLLAIAHGGQILLSQAARDQVRALPEEATLSDLGAHRLRDLQQPERVWQLAHPDLPAGFPPLRSLNVRFHNLPVQSTSLIGRELEVAAVRHHLAQTRLLTITGSGGCGKTRLMLQVAAELIAGEGEASAQEHPAELADGCWFAELAPLADPDLVPQAVAGALGLKERPGEPLSRTICEHLKEKQLLLLLDNCEHLLDASAALVDSLLRACPGIRILVSSRERLNNPGEQVYPVPSLRVPVGRDSPEELLDSEAGRLFVDRARAAQPAFVLTPRGAAAIAQVCRRLDGIPLALELAAARVRSITPDQLLGRLDDRFRLLTGGARTALPRQQTLRATIDWSYDLLSEPERVLLRRLSIFTGGWTLEAAEAVCGDSQVAVSSAAVLDLLTSLVDKSLVVMDAPGEGFPRYRLLETIRQYAREPSSGPGSPEAVACETPALRNRHRDWYLALAEEAAPQLTGPQQIEWLDRLEVEHDNLRAALEWSEQPGDENPDAGLRLASALWRFWDMRGYLREGSDRLTRSLSAADQVGPRAPLAAAFYAAGRLAQYRGDYGASLSCFERSRAICAVMEDRSGLAQALSGLGAVAGLQGRHGDARPLLEGALALFRELGDRPGIASSLTGLGAAAYRQGDLAAARPVLEEAVAMRRQLGNKQGIGISLAHLGAVTLDQGQVSEARAHLAEALSLFRALGDRWSSAVILRDLADAAVQQGDHALARSLLRESLATGGELGDRERVAGSLETLVRIAVEQRSPDFEGAARMLGAAEGIREVMGSPAPADKQAAYQRTVAAVEFTLGRDRLAAAWAEGRAMTLEEAVACALQEEPDPPAP